jgi:penicillin-binding protein 1A
MNHIVGGDIPASIWRRYMLAAHEGLAVRDFPWLLPDPAPLSTPDPRNGFYETLGAEFARSASELEPASDALEAPTPSAAPPPEQLPY